MLYYGAKFQKLFSKALSIRFYLGTSTPSNLWSFSWCDLEVRRNLFLHTQIHPHHDPKLSLPFTNNCNEASIQLPVDTFLRSILFWPRGTQKSHILQVQVISLHSQTIGHDNDFIHIPHLVLTLNYAATCPYILQVHPLPPIITSWACLSPLRWGCALSPS